jgi:hypothetical protein
MVSPGNRNPLEGDPNDAAASPEPCVIKKRLGNVFHELARRRESKIEEGKNQEMQDRELDQLLMIP